MNSRRGETGKKNEGERMKTCVIWLQGHVTNAVVIRAESCWVTGEAAKLRAVHVTRTYLPKPAIPNLLQVEKTVAAQVCGLQELDWTA